MIVSLLWHTMVRVGSIQSLDVEDYNAEEQSLRLRHRPETDTPLKNKHRGKRHLALSKASVSSLTAISRTVDAT